MVNAMKRAGLETRMALSHLIDELKEHASAHHDAIEVRVMPRWISLRSRRGKRVFAELRPSKRRGEVFVSPPPRELGFSRLVCRAPPSQGWDWFKSKFCFEGDGDVRSALRLLRISYISSIRTNVSPLRRRRKNSR